MIKTVPAKNTSGKPPEAPLGVASRYDSVGKAQSRKATESFCRVRFPNEPLLRLFGETAPTILSSLRVKCLFFTQSSVLKKIKEIVNLVAIDGRK